MVLDQTSPLPTVDSLLAQDTFALGLQKILFVRSSFLEMLGGLFGNVCTVDCTFEVEPNRKTAAIGRDKKGHMGIGCAISTVCAACTIPIWGPPKPCGLTLQFAL